eukprot:6212973-Pleurochrysis_carterae.AAC.2
MGGFPVGCAGHAEWRACGERIGAATACGRGGERARDGPPRPLRVRPCSASDAASRRVKASPRLRGHVA